MSEEKVEFTNYDLIYTIVKQIPKGKVTSYGIIAKLIGVGIWSGADWRSACNASKVCRSIEDNIS